MLYRISVAVRGLTGIANIFRSRLSRLDDLLRAGTVPLSKCFPQVMGGVGHLCTCAHAPPSPYLRIRVANCAQSRFVARDPIVTRFTRVGGGVTTFARACPVSLSRKPLSPGIKATPKTDFLFLARSFIAKHGVLLVGIVDVFKAGGDWKLAVTTNGVAVEPHMIMVTEIQN